MEKRKSGNGKIAGERSWSTGRAQKLHRVVWRVITSFVLFVTLALGVRCISGYLIRGLPMDLSPLD